MLEQASSDGNDGGDDGNEEFFDEEICDENVKGKRGRKAKTSFLSFYKVKKWVTVERLVEMHISFDSFVSNDKFVDASGEVVPAKDAYKNAKSTSPHIDEVSSALNRFIPRWT